MSQRRILLVAVAALGVSAFVTQVTLMREMLGALAGNELVFGIVLGSWMLLTGAGAMLGRAARSLRDPPGMLIVLEVLIAWLPIAAVLALRMLWNTVFVRGAAVGVPESVAASLVLLAPYCLVTGFALTLAGLVLGGEGPEGIGRVYLCDSLGGIAGGLAFSLAWLWWCNPFGILYGSASLNLLAAAALAWGYGRKRLLGATIVLAACLVATVAACDLDALSTRAQYPGQEVVFRGHSPYGRLVVTRLGSQLNFIENGLLLFSTRNVEEVEESVHYAMAQRPDARRVLLVSGGISGTAGEVLKYGVEAVDYVELDPLVLQVAGQLLPERLADPRIHVIQTDGRQFVRRPGEAYDVIIVDVPDPSTFQTNRFYTLEFLAQAARRLRPDGVLCCTLGRYDDYVGPEQARLMSVLWRTLHEVFASVLVLPGGRLFFLASDGDLSTDVAARLAARGVPVRLMNRHYLQATLSAERLADVRRAVSDDAPLNQDFSPLLCYYHLRYWLRQFPVGFSLLQGALLALLVVYLVRLRPVPLAIFSGGLAASALEVVLLMGFQILYGSTYRQVSLIVLMFMLGLGLGSWTMNRMLARRTRKALIVLQLALAALALAVPPLLGALARLETPALVWLGRAVIPALMMGLATLVGMEFPLAAKLDFQAVTSTAARLYTADYVGAALGALLVSTLLIPLIGVSGVSWSVAGLNILSVAILCKAATSGRGVGVSPVLSA